MIKTISYIIGYILGKSELYYLTLVEWDLVCNV